MAYYCVLLNDKCFPTSILESGTIDEKHARIMIAIQCYKISRHQGQGCDDSHVVVKIV